MSDESCYCMLRYLERDPFKLEDERFATLGGRENIKAVLYYDRRRVIGSLDVWFKGFPGGNGVICIYLHIRRIYEDSRINAIRCFRS